jgi:hypothetical protein
VRDHIAALSPCPTISTTLTGAGRDIQQPRRTADRPGLRCEGYPLIASAHAEKYDHNTRGVADNGSSLSVPIFLGPQSPELLYGAFN